MRVDILLPPSMPALPPSGPSQTGERVVLRVLGVPIDVISPAGAVERIAAWAQRHESRYVCICNAHSVVTATQDRSFHDVLKSADLSTPDGAPVAWMLRRLGARGQTRVAGPDLMLAYCEHAAASGEPLFLLGSTPPTLQALTTRLLEMWPTLHIAGTLSPPFRSLTDQEDEAIVQTIAQSGARTVWVSLGCPKQERWMADHRDRVPAVMIGVGAAFDFHAGAIRRAPAWMRDSGFEWLHRLSNEPKRLWRRYLVTNLAFIAGAARQLLRHRDLPDA